MITIFVRWLTRGHTPPVIGTTLEGWTDKRRRDTERKFADYIGDVGCCYSSCGEIKVVRDDAAIAHRERKFVHPLYMVRKASR